MTYLNKTELTAGDVDETLGVLLKYQDDIAKVRGAEAARLVTEVAAAGYEGFRVAVPAARQFAAVGE